jgi:hypothetical protein
VTARLINVSRLRVSCADSLLDVNSGAFVADICQHAIAATCMTLCIHWFALRYTAQSERTATRLTAPPDFEGLPRSTPQPAPTIEPQPQHRTGQLLARRGSLVRLLG